VKRNADVLNDEEQVMRFLSGFVAGLAGLLSCWLIGAIAGTFPSSVGVGKDILVLYFSVFVFFILFIPVYVIGRRVIFKFVLVFRFCSPDVVYCFLLGLGVLPALMSGDLIIGLIESVGAFKDNATRFALLLSFTGVLDFLFGAASYLTLWKIFGKSRNTSGL
jgi:hypothetical protein